MMGREITFRPATFYLGIVDMLAGEVEGQAPVDKRGEESRPSTAGTEAGRGVDVAEDGRGVDEPAPSAQPQQHMNGDEPLQRTSDEETLGRKRS
jgi:triacylglycerol lipase